MGTPSVGMVVTVRFPFSDLSNSKKRPTVVLAPSDRGDWILCQITSNAYADISAVLLENDDFSQGSLQKTSYARPGKIFTANEALMANEIGQLKDKSFRKVSEAVISLLQANIPGWFD